MGTSRETDVWLEKQIKLNRDCNKLSKKMDSMTEENQQILIENSLKLMGSLLKKGE